MNKRIFVFIIILTFLQVGAAQHQSSSPELSFIAQNLEWKGIAIQDENYTIWGCAPIQGEDGKIHLFAARWPEKNVDPAWRKSSEIAHYVAGDRTVCHVLKINLD